MEEGDDFAIALQLQAQFDAEVNAPDDEYGRSGKSTPDLTITGHSMTQGKEMSLVDPQWETLDPIPDVRALFVEFNDKYFWGRLAGVEVRWSPRMTLCAGLCVYEGRGGMCSVRLSEPLLKLRPRKDLIETLLHEMIHAFLFVTDNNKDHDGHGPEFCKHMKRLNDKCGTSISIYHSFHDEVDHHRQHWWRCDGPCQTRKPYFGYVKRAMNRVPSPRDTWWAQHQASCGGKYTKVKEPDGYGKKKDKKKDMMEKKIEEKKPEKPSGSADIRSLFKKKDEEDKKEPKKPSGSLLKTNTSASIRTISSEDPKPKKPSGSLLKTNTSATIRTISSEDSTSTSSSIPASFTGSGVTIGGRNPNQGNGPIVRNIPGIGLITTERHDPKNVKSVSNETTPNKRPLSVSDSENSDKKKRRIGSEDSKGLNRQAKSLSDFLNGKSQTPPGTAEKVPGFKSTANRKNWSEKEKKNTKPVVNGNVHYIPLGKRPNVTPNSARKVISRVDKGEIKRGGGATSTFTPTSARDGEGIWAREIGREGRNDASKDKSGGIGNRGSDNFERNSGSIASGSQSAKTGAHSSSAGASGSWTGASSSSAGAGSSSAGAGSSWTGASNSSAGAKSTSTSADPPKVPCPVCSTMVQENLINQHLDSCLS